jgi:hypothetical protein
MTVIAAATPHITALITRLRAQFPGSVTVFDAEVPDDPPQAYAVVWAAPGSRYRSSMAVATDWWEATIQITCVGTSERQALDVADLTATALSGYTLTVAGRQCWPITQVDLEQPVQRDDTIRDPVTNRSRFYVPTQWVLRSCPTT